MPERTLKELNQTYAVLNEVDPEMARRFKAMVYPEKAIAELEKDLADLRETHTALFNRWRDSREELHELRMSLVTLGFNRRTVLPEGIEQEFKRWEAAYEHDLRYPEALPFPSTRQDALKVGYFAGRCADQYYKENPLGQDVHALCVFIRKYPRLVKFVPRVLKWLA